MTATETHLSQTAFWSLPLADRAAAFAVLRAQDRPVFFPEPDVPFAEKGPGFYALVRHADVTEASRHPEVFCSRKGRDEHPRPSGRVQRVLRLDDQHGRPQAHPAAADRLPRVQPPADRQVRSRRAPGGRRGRRRPADHRAVRFRSAGRGQAATEDHLRHDGHPRSTSTRWSWPTPTSSCPGPTRNSSARTWTRRWSGSSAPGRRSPSWSPAWPPDAGARRRDRARPGLRAGDREHRRRAADQRRAGLVLHPAGRGGQRDHPQRALARADAVHRVPRPACAAPRGPRGTDRRAPSTRSCATPHRSSSCAGP